MVFQGEAVCGCAGKNRDGGGKGKTPPPSGGKLKKGRGNSPVYLPTIGPPLLDGDSLRDEGDIFLPGPGLYPGGRYLAERGPDTPGAVTTPEEPGGWWWPGGPADRLVASEAVAVAVVVRGAAGAAVREAVVMGCAGARFFLIALVPRRGSELVLCLALRPLPP